MPTLHESFNTIVSDLKTAEPTSYMVVKPGDKVARVSYGVITLLTVADRFGDRLSTAEGAEIYAAGRNVELYLIDRPKPPLPSEPDARIVAWEIGHETYPEGIVLTRTHDREESPWESLEEYHADSDIHEWALLPDNLFADLRKDSIK